jgi:hypothetical protein
MRPGLLLHRICLRLIPASLPEAKRNAWRHFPVLSKLYR